MAIDDVSIVLFHQVASNIHNVKLHQRLDHSPFRVNNLRDINLRPCSSPTTTTTTTTTNRLLLLNLSTTLTSYHLVSFAMTSTSPIFNLSVELRNRVDDFRTIDKQPLVHQEDLSSLR